MGIPLNYHLRSKLIEFFSKLYLRVLGRVHNILNFKKLTDLMNFLTLNTQPHSVNFLSNYHNFMSKIEVILWY